ncbi:MAG: hypothetical protein A2622_04490 [Bdellovibrionales bacterium RIFCSPHIGHO2_01_FULL_40_29]|nr:MAG: hypothetical protein A2622_04490 [Bdellovibrionales bacterium RIFCSPHIGHO2_01_FULL_40_29]OFZ34807.1 MAG: hypothetical protein A3D17_10885 [Bdellovibrionales bacterium RIFCSPHIGHO2_02_FULL_40_15]
MTDSVTGENSDLFIQGQKIHVQTEDWGTREKVLVSRIFRNGSVLKTFKLPYEKIPSSDKRVQRETALNRLHQYSIDWAQKESEI